MDDLAHARALLADAARVAVLTGAGISTASGIGDFRGPQGRWTLDPDAERVSTLSWYLSDPDVRAKAWAFRAESPVYDAQPNPAHTPDLWAEWAADPLSWVHDQNRDVWILH